MNLNIELFKNNPYLEVITGPMYSGKSMEINRRLVSIYYYNKSNPDKAIKSIVVRPLTDTRSEDTRKIPYKEFEQMLVDADLEDFRDQSIFIDKLSNFDFIVFDEAQFLSESYIYVIQKLLEHDKYILVAGLDKDYTGEPFSEFMKWAVCDADSVSKLTGLCSNCGKPSTAVHLLADTSNLENNIVVEDSNNRYLPMCRKCLMKFRRRVKSNK